MRLRTALAIALVTLSALAASGCDQGRKAPAKTRVQVVHAAPSYPSLDFWREERMAVEELAYGGVSGVLVFDVDQYDFHVGAKAPNSPVSDRIHSLSTEIAAEVDYTIVLTEDLGAVRPVILETPVAAAGAGAQVTVLHAGNALPPVDVFVEPAGTDLTTASPLARVAFLQNTAPLGRAGGDYVVTVTATDHPTAVLLASEPLTLSAAQRIVLVLLDGADEGTAPIFIAVAQDSPGSIVDKDVGGALRVVNAAADQAARDVAIGEEFTPPLLAGVPFGSASAYAPLVRGDHTASVTPAGNPGVVEGTTTVGVAASRLYTLVVAGSPGEIGTAVLVDDRRRLNDRAKLGLLNGATQFSSVTVYVLLPGTDPATVNPITSTVAPSGSQYLGLLPGDYELVLRDSEQLTVAGPVPFTVAAGGLYTVLAVNGPDAGSAGVVLLDDFTP